MHFNFNLFLGWKAEFSALLQSSVSHDSSDIILICWFAAQQTFIIINVEKTLIYILCRISLLINFMHPEYNIYIYTYIHTYILYIQQMHISCTIPLNSISAFKRSAAETRTLSALVHSEERKQLFVWAIFLSAKNLSDMQHRSLARQSNSTSTLPLWDECSWHHKWLIRRLTISHPLCPPS